MRISRRDTVVRVTEPGHSEDETHIYEFRILEDYCEDAFDVLAAADGHQPKARLSFLRRGSSSILGEHWTGLSLPLGVQRSLEARGYIVDR